MKKTALYEVHKESGAKFVEFAGWDMPVEYESLIKEHLAVRSAVGIFDVSHMGEIQIKGNDALELSQKLSSNNIFQIYPKQAQYALLCNHKGGVVDDVIFYMFSENHLMICANAANTEKDYNWITKIKKEFGFKSDVLNISDKYSQIAVQGPDAQRLLIKTMGNAISAIKRFRFGIVDWKGVETIVARTGYTGEDGYEVFLPWNSGPDIWKELIGDGEEYNIQACGIGCRDTLRIEMGYPLYGNELSDNINPIESGLGTFVKVNDKNNDFVGKTAILNQLHGGLTRKLVGFEMIDPGVPRKGYDLLEGDSVIGTVTSGTHSPSLNKSIGMGLIDINCHQNNLCIDIRNKKRKIEIVDLPFYKK